VKPRAVLQKPPIFRGTLFQFRYLGAQSVHHLLVIGISNLLFTIGIRPLILPEVNVANATP
jgi:hypothetical protein